MQRENCVFRFVCVAMKYGDDAEVFVTRGGNSEYDVADGKLE